MGMGGVQKAIVCAHLCRGVCVLCLSGHVPLCPSLLVSQQSHPSQLSVPG